MALNRTVSELKFMTEREWEGYLIRHLNKAGALVFSVSSTAKRRNQAVDWPDLYICSRKWTGWLELKTGDRPLTKGQEKRLMQIENEGVRAYILRFKDGMYRIEKPIQGCVAAFVCEDPAAELLNRLRAVG